MLMHIGVFLMAVSFAIFAILLSKLLRQISSTIGSAGKSFDQMESKLDATVNSLENTIESTEITLIDMETKLNAIDSVFVSAGKVGDSARLATDELEELTSDYANQKELPGAMPFIRIIQSAEFVSGLFGSWKDGKRRYTRRNEGFK